MKKRYNVMTAQFKIIFWGLVATICFSCASRVPETCRDFFEYDKKLDRQSYFNGLPPEDRIQVYICTMTYSHPRNLFWQDSLAKEGMEIVPHLFSFIKKYPKTVWLIRDVFQLMDENDYCDLSKIEDNYIVKLEEFTKTLNDRESQRGLRSVVLLLRSKK